MVLLLLVIMIVAAAFIPFLGGLAMTLFGPVFAAGIVVGCKALDEGEELELGHLFAGFREPHRHADRRGRALPSRPADRGRAGGRPRAMGVGMMR